MKEEMSSQNSSRSELPESTFDDQDHDDVDDLEVQPMVSMNKEISRRPSVIAQTYTSFQIATF